jgi:D-glycero-alpha-D-manno-heptose 1-phosphate guanylyltransferase
MIQEAIILAGGLGTRLREAVPDLPKCMAPVAGRPFLSYVIDALRMQGIQHFVFSLGYKADVIEEYLKEHYPTLDYSTTIEDEPLGTGGAIKLALSRTRSENILIANGDTLFKVNVEALASFHIEKESACTLALKPMYNFERYGVVELDSDNRIITFKEKQYYTAGLINGGIYLLNKQQFLQHQFPQKFSFEKEYLETYFDKGIFYGLIQDEYFIDIGIPEDYNKAQNDLKQAVLDLKNIDKSWTLFLDRDGVINDERLNNYVLHWEQFIFSKGVLEAFKILSEKFGKIVIVSNQRGVGKGLMTEETLMDIHKEMQKEVESAGGHLDKIYYCTEVHDTHFGRKPNPGMAYQATKDFPEIELNKAIMVGNKPSDMRFGRAAGLFTVFVRTTNPDQDYPHPDIDLCFNSLLDFAYALKS